MSKDIFESKNMLVTAFVGTKGNKSIQIGMKGNATYEQLTQEEALELCHALLSRVLYKEGYRATD